VGVVALFVGTLPAGFGMPWWVSLPVGALLLSVLLRVFGTPVETYTPSEEEVRVGAEAGA
jgi:hypothetical protein